MIKYSKGQQQSTSHILIDGYRLEWAYCISQDMLMMIIETNIIVNILLVESND